MTPMDLSFLTKDISRGPVETRVMLISGDPVSRKGYQEALVKTGVIVDTVASFREFYYSVLATPYNGVLVDVPTKIRTPNDEKDLVKAIMDLFPVIQLKFDPATGKISTYFTGQLNKSCTLDEFINNECRRFIARTARSSERKTKHLNVMLGQEKSGRRSPFERTVTLNVSKGDLRPNFSLPSITLRCKVFRSDFLAVLARNLRHSLLMKSSRVQLLFN